MVFSELVGHIKGSFGKICPIFKIYIYVITMTFSYEVIKRSKKSFPPNNSNLLQVVVLKNNNLHHYLT